MSVKLLTEHNLEFLSLTRGCTGSFECTLVKMPHCLKSHVAAQLCSMLCTYQMVAHVSFKDIDHCPIEIIKGLTHKGQFQYPTKLMGPEEGTYLYTTQFHSLR